MPVAIPPGQEADFETRLRFDLQRWTAVTPAMLHSIDEKGELISVSDAWLAKLGYTRSEVLGRPSSDFLTEESREHALRNVLGAPNGNKPLSLVMFGVDRFKLFNDRYGHPADDNCLRRVAAAIAETARPSGDLTAAMEEFALLLPDTDEAVLPVFFRLRLMDPLGIRSGRILTRSIGAMRPPG